MIGSESESRQILTSQTGKLRLTVLVLNIFSLMPGESVVVTQPLEGNDQPMPLSVRTGMDCHGHQSSAGENLSCKVSCTICLSFESSYFLLYFILPSSAVGVFEPSS